LGIRLEWIEDLIAIAESPTLSAAAVRRNVTQPAFTRRLRRIEEALGIALVDRSRKPARPTQALIDRRDDLHALAGQVHRIAAEMAAGAQGETLVPIACQHSLALSVMPRMVTALRTQMPNVTVRLRAANHDECFSMLAKGRVATMLSYDAPELRPDEADPVVERCLLMREPLTPVVLIGSAADLALAHGRSASMICYPEETFLGRLMRRERVRHGLDPGCWRCVCETELTPGVLQLVLAGVGFAWLPRMLTEGHVAAGRLREVSLDLPLISLDVVMLRLRAARPMVENEVWATLRREAASIVPN